MSSQIRSNSFWKRAYHFLVQTATDYYGITKKTILVGLHYWKPELCHSIDAMHLVHGLHKKLIELWSSKSLISSKKWQQFDRIYTRQKIHSVFKRPIRSIVEDGSYYKCSEALMFVLYLSPILKSYLPKEYFDHHMILVDSLNHLFDERITTESLQKVCVV